MCGKNYAEFKAEIEGVELSVCSSCSKHGKVIKKIPAVQPAAARITSSKKSASANQTADISNEPKQVRMIVEDFASRIRSRREKLRLNQEDFAKKLSIKESQLHSFETGKIVPSTAIAEKMERILGIKLIELSDASFSIQKSSNQSDSKSGSDITIGDFVKIRSRKKQ